MNDEMRSKSIPSTDQDYPPNEDIITKQVLQRLDNMHQWHTKEEEEEFYLMIEKDLRSPLAQTEYLEDDIEFEWIESQVADPLERFVIIEYVDIDE